jgi:hypothetical protein
VFRYGIGNLESPYYYGESLFAVDNGILFWQRPHFSFAFSIPRFQCFPHSKISLINNVCTFKVNFMVYFHASFVILCHVPASFGIHPFDNYVTTTLFSTYDHLKWNGFQVCFSRAMGREAEHPSLTHSQKIILDFDQ